MKQYSKDWKRIWKKLEIGEKFSLVILLFLLFVFPVAILLAVNPVRLLTRATHPITPPISPTPCIRGTPYYQIAPVNLSGNPGQKLTYLVSIATNDSSIYCSNWFFQLEKEGPPGWNVEMGLAGYDFGVPFQVGPRNSLGFPLYITSPQEGTDYVGYTFVFRLSSPTVPYSETRYIVYNLISERVTVTITPNLIITTDQFIDGVVNQPYWYRFYAEARGGIYDPDLVLTANNLPPGLSVPQELCATSYPTNVSYLVKRVECVLAGTPTETGTFDVVVTVSDNFGSSISKIVPITIKSASTITPGVCDQQGDANGDCKVDGLDYAIWFINFGRITQNGPKDADFDRSGSVDGLDYAIWFINLFRYK